MIPFRALTPSLFPEFSHFQAWRILEKDLVLENPPKHRKIVEMGCSLNFVMKSVWFEAASKSILSFWWVLVMLRKTFNTVMFVLHVLGIAYNVAVLLYVWILHLESSLQCIIFCKSLEFGVFSTMKSTGKQCRNVRVSPVILSALNNCSEI